MFTWLLYNYIFLCYIISIYDVLILSLFVSKRSSGNSFAFLFKTGLSCLLSKLAFISNERKRRIDWFFYFLDPYGGHWDLFQAFKLRNYFLNTIYPSKWKTKSWMITFFLTFVTTFKISVLKTSILLKVLHASKLIFLSLQVAFERFSQLNLFFTPPFCL